MLADFMLAWHKLYPEIPPNPDRYDYDEFLGERLAHMKSVGTLDDFYLNIPPLIKPDELPFEPICYLTARPVDTKISEYWLKANGFPEKKVVTVGIDNSKVIAAKDAGINIFIDDYYGNFKELNDAGVLTYLYSAPWNMNYDVGNLRLNSMKELNI